MRFFRETHQEFPDRTLSLYMSSLDLTMSVPKMMQAYTGVPYLTMPRYIEAMSLNPVVFDTVLERFHDEGWSSYAFGGGGIYNTKLGHLFDGFHVDP